MLRPAPHTLLLSLALSALTLLGCDPAPVTGSCSRDTDCNAGQVCRDGLCEAGLDAGREPDAGDDTPDTGPMCTPARTCGDACCSAGQTCSSDTRCCATADLCGGVCCDGDDRVCVADECVLDCGDTAACGDGADARCCGASEVCLLGSCTEPGAECEGAFDCAEGEYCDPSIGRCLPRATGGDECEYRPMTGEFELQEEWHWSGDAEVLPAHDQVMSAPMVANLTDDNGDGRIDENDIPDVVFNTFHRANPLRQSGDSTYGIDGVLRAISGADGSRIWPTSDPGYRTHPSLEVAIADVRADSPGPEIIGCTFEPGQHRGASRLTLFSNEGAILHRFTSVGCGRPAVADMNADGVAEIVVGSSIVQADGSGVVTTAASTRNSISVIYDIDDDPELEVIGLNAVFDHTGAVQWQDTAVFNTGGGYTAVADMDGDSDPDIVAVNSTLHMVTVRDGRTGTLLAGPTEVTPVGVPSIDARVAAIMAARPDRDALTGGGPPTIANFDDDAQPEFSLAGGYAYAVFEADTSRNWFFETQDTSSRATGSSVFDFEGDGRAEVLYNDERYLRAFRGGTGDVYLERCNTSGTLTEYPIVVDVDNDDHAEVIVAENNYAFRSCDDGSDSTTGIHAFGHPTNDWVRTRRIWNQHSYHVTNINEDGTLPLIEERNYTNPRLNNFRQNVQPDGLFDAPDLVLRDPSFSTAACAESALIMRVRVFNNGRAGAPAGVPVSFYVDGTYVGQVATTRTLLPGASEVVELRQETVTLGETYTFTAVLNDPAHDPLVGINECRPDNNGTDSVTGACPNIG